MQKQRDEIKSLKQASQDKDEALSKKDLEV